MTTTKQKLDEALDAMPHDRLSPAFSEKLTVWWKEYGPVVYEAAREYSRILAGDVVVVPREPTEKMVAAAIGRDTFSSNMYSDIYCAMIAAAQEPAEVGTTVAKGKEGEQ